MPEIGHNKDFFISYNHRDANWAEWIAWELEESGYSTKIQAWDFRVGANFVIEMDTGLKEAKRMIAVLSPNYFNSQFTPSEWAVQFAKDPTGKDRRLIPVRVQEVDADGLLGQIVYIDVVGKDEKAARAELLSKIREERAKPSRKPQFPMGSHPKAFPGTIAHPKRDVQFELVLSGGLQVEDKSQVEAIVRHLQNLLRDPHLTLLEVRAGSIILRLRCSQAGFERLRMLHKDGGLSEIMGFTLEQIRPFRLNVYEIGADDESEISALRLRLFDTPRATGEKRLTEAKGALIYYEGGKEGAPRGKGPKYRANRVGEEVVLRNSTEVEYWTKQLGVTEEQLVRLIDEHGTSAAKIRGALGMI
jgi:hypothetical protein